MVALFLDAPGARDYPLTSPRRTIRCRAKQCPPLRIIRFLLPILPYLLLSTPSSLCQDSANEGTIPRGDRAEISLTVRDSSGEPISAPATAKLYRDGMPVDNAATAHGRAFFVFRTLGSYTVIVEATGYKAAQMDPGNARVLGALRMALTDQGKYDEAIPPLEKSLQMEAGGWETHWALGKSYYYHQQYDQALKASQQALTGSNGKAPQIELLVAQSLTAVGRYDDAALTLRDFLKSHGDRPEAATARRWLDGLVKNGKIRRE